MATTSPNLNLTLPDANDNVNVSVLSGDFTIIDSAYGTTTGTISTLNGTVTSLGTTVSTLNNTVTGLNTTVGGHTTSIANLTTAVDGKAAATHSHASDSWFTSAIAGKANVLSVQEFSSGSITCAASSFNTATITPTLSNYTPIAAVGFTVQDYTSGGTTSRQYATPLGFELDGSTAKVYFVNRDTASHKWKATVRILFVHN